MPWYDIFRMKGILRRGQSPTYLTDVRPPATEALLHVEDDIVDEAKVRKDHEYGVPGDNVFAGFVSRPEYNPLFTGDRAWDTINKMRMADGSIKCVLAVMKLPLLRTEVAITTEKPDETDAKNKLIAETCQKMLLGQGAIHETWQAQLKNFLLMLDFGFSVTERVWTVDDEGFLRYKRMAPRLPQTITNFKVNSDGSLKAVIQNAPKNGIWAERTIPAPLYATVMSWEKEGENHWGQSVMRAIYKHHYYKEMFYRLDAIRLDRWSTGIPRAQWAKDYQLKPADKSDLITALREIRGGERSFMMHPKEIEIDILGMMESADDIGLMDSVNHHDSMIFRSIMAQFITTANAQNGNYGSTRTYSEMFMYAEQAMAQFVEEEYFIQVIKPFCDANFDMHDRPYPRLRWADLQRFDMGLVAEALGKFATSKVITPTDDLEDVMRKMWGWPVMPEWAKGRREEMASQVNPDEPNPDGPNPDDPERRPSGGRPRETGAAGNRRVDQRARPR